MGFSIINLPFVDISIYGNPQAYIRSPTWLDRRDFSWCSANWLIIILNHSRYLEWTSKYSRVSIVYYSVYIPTMACTSVHDKAALAPLVIFVARQWLKRFWGCPNGLTIWRKWSTFWASRRTRSRSLGHPGPPWALGPSLGVPMNGGRPKGGMNGGTKGLSFDHPM